ncbi:MAG TPA: COX15/CtaA family protein [Xanthobacteraceae bacterium]
MSIGLVQYATAAGTRRPPRGIGRRWADALDDPTWMARARRALLVVTALLAIPAFVLAVGNRFTEGPLFVYVPDVDLLPPMSKTAWEQAFVIHQQNPLFALCGGYQVSGMESLTVYQLIYGWEWLRAASVGLLCISLFALAALALRNALRPQGGRDLRALIGAALLLASYAALRYFADHAGLFATINVGQHRHALDVTFASVALALLLTAFLPQGEREAPSRTRVAWAIAIALDIAFGAMFQTTDASAVWKTFPGYGDALLPGPDRLFAFHPVWRNLTENAYFIQAAHRLLSFALWLAALVGWPVCWWRRQSLWRATVLVGLLTAEGALGAATLLLDLPLVLSIAHQFCAVLVLAAAIAPAAPWRRSPAGARVGPRAAFA